MAENWGFEPDKGRAFFISYNSPDWQRVAPIAKALSDMGYPIWYDKGLAAGTARWKAQISAGIDRCYAVIVFVTNGIFNRDKCYVLNEHDEATGINKPVIPVFLDNISLSGVPTYYRAYVTEWSSMQGVPYRNESPYETVQRIAYAIESGYNIEFKLTGNPGSQPVRIPVQAPVPQYYVQNRQYTPVSQYSQGVNINYTNTKAGGKGGRKTRNAVIAAVLFAALLCGIISIPFIIGRTTEQSTETKTVQLNKNVAAGDHVYFGSYVQNEYNSEPIEWLVLEVNHGKALLVSKDLLACKPYNSGYSSVTWSECSLRKWLNEDFYNEAFTYDEQETIALSKIKNSYNTYSFRAGGEDTEDYVFCLSIDEANKYLDSCGDLKTAKPTAYAVRYRSDDQSGAWWWLRSVGSDGSRAASVNSVGAVNTGGNGVSSGNGFVRPAVWVRL